MHPEWYCLAILDVQTSGVPLIYSPHMRGLTILFRPLANTVAPSF